MSRFVLITGRMGSGKSKVSELLRKKHYTVIDSDSEVKKLYENPAVFQEIVNGLGPWVLDDNGRIDTSKLLNEVFTGDDECRKQWRNVVMNAVIWEFIDQLTQRYKDNKEIVFIEAALTPEVGWVRHHLDIYDVIMVKTDEKTRLDRLYSRPNYELLMMLDKTQNEKYLNLYKSASNPTGSSIDPPDIMAAVENNGTEEALNDRLMEVLEKELNITHEEKIAVYLRYLKEAPNYCHDNAWCYSFFNLGGCTNCPFPCANHDKYYRKLNENFLRSKRQ